MKIVLTTFNNKQQATDFAANLVKKKLAACVNMLPTIESVYFWENKIQKDMEILLIIKTSESKLEELEQYFSANHPYNVFEFVVIDPCMASSAYSLWLNKYLS